MTSCSLYHKFTHGSKFTFSPAGIGLDNNGVSTKALASNRFNFDEANNCKIGTYQSLVSRLAQTLSYIEALKQGSCAV